jgi:hypothetical protein
LSINRWQHARHRQPRRDEGNVPHRGDLQIEFFSRLARIRDLQYVPRAVARVDAKGVVLLGRKPCCYAIYAIHTARNVNGINCVQTEEGGRQAAGQQGVERR